MGPFLRDTFGQYSSSIRASVGCTGISRMMPVFDQVLVARDVVLYTGLITAAMAATMGLVASDIKRVLAFSTMSQLGFMFVALGLGSVSAAMFHLFTHAFFKALLFLGAGSVIVGLHHDRVSVPRRRR